MKIKAPSGSNFRIITRLLARKGGAEPMLKKEARLELVSDARDATDDSQHLTDAVVSTTAQRLASPSSPRVRKAPAPLTDLLDPSLVGSVSQNSGQVARLCAPSAPEEQLAPRLPGRAGK